MQNFDRPYFQSISPVTFTTATREEGSYKLIQDMLLMGNPAQRLKVYDRSPKLTPSERQQLYVQHRMRVQNAKSVIDSKPPVRPPSGCQVKEMTFMDLLNTVRNALHSKTEVSPRTFTKTPEAVQRLQQVGARSMSVHLGHGDGQQNRNVHEMRGRRDKSVAAFSLSRSHCALRASEPVMRRGDMQKFVNYNHERHRSWQSVPSRNHKDSMSCAHKKPSPEVGRSRSKRISAKRRNLADKSAASRNANQSTSNICNPRSTLRADVRVGSHTNARSTVNLRTTDSERCDLPARTENLTLKEVRERQDSKKYHIPVHVLRRYEGLMMVRNMPLLRKLLRPRIYFDLEVKGLRPLGRLLIQMYTEACPEVVLEFVRACTLSNRERINFTRLLPPLWLEGELSLTDNRTLTANTIEHDTDILDHGSGAGILSFPSRYVRGSKRRFLSFSISFKPLQVLNGKRIAFGRVRRGHWILDAIQDYGTNSGKPKREIIMTKCGLLQ